MNIQAPTSTMRRALAFAAALVAIAAAVACAPYAAFASGLAPTAPGTRIQAVERLLYVFPDGTVQEYASEDDVPDSVKDDDTVAIMSDVVSGTTTYDAASKALTVNGLVAGGIELHRSFALKLEGANTLNAKAGDSAIDAAAPVTLTIAGPGSLDIMYPKGKGSGDGAIHLGRSHNNGAALVITGGTLRMTEGISIERGNFTMTGGTVSVGSIETTPTRKNGKVAKYGKVKVTGGELRVDYSIEAEGHMSNKASCLKSVGAANAKSVEVDYRLPLGASFISGGNEFQYCVHNEGKPGEVRYAKLVKYNAKSKTPKFGKTVKFGKLIFDLRGVATNAFATKAGAKVKKLTMSGQMRFIDAKALAGTKSLTSLAIGLPVGWAQIEYEPYPSSASHIVGYMFKFSSDSKVSGKAFSGCGKADGKKLAFTPLVDNPKTSSSKYIKYPGPKNLAKKALVKKGLSKKARIA